MSTPSFPPSFSSFPDLDALSNSKSERDVSREDFKQEKKKKGEPSSKKEKHRKREKEGNKKSHRGSGERTPPPEGPSSKHEESWQFEKNRLFYSDRRGDPLNIQYGGLHAGDIPRYHVVDSKVIRFFLGDN